MTAKITKKTSSPARKDALGNLTEQFEQSVKDQNAAEAVFGSDKSVLQFMIHPDAEIVFDDEKRPGVLSRFAAKIRRRSPK